MIDRQARANRNEAYRRDVNQVVEDIHARERDSPLLQIICECARAGCTNLIEITQAAYTAVRTHPSRFIITTGHQLPDVETIVDRTTSYLVVEKHGVVTPTPELA